MRKNEATIFIFIASIAIGILISMNISFKKVNARTFLNVKQYQEALNEKNKLYAEVSNLKEKYNDYYEKLEKYENQLSNEKEIREEVNKEIFQNKLQLGTIPVEGPGVKIVLNDADKQLFEGGTHEENKLKLIHNTDIIQVINDLKNAKVEAISLNGQRITNISDIYCDGTFIGINGGIKLLAPFYIEVIGDKASIKEYMLRNDGYLQILMLRKIYVDIQEKDKIIVPAYTNDKKPKNIRSTEK
ncbi:DUF881 domain-containing protein [Clostridium botulinum]|uniref:DUF881 domain-containing protein n=1 Tax=Clostridium botulinum TaxID=1491 RepID=UPI000A175F02|nr:DUF881 domain-containing protein [Clostridium botulinum]OSA81543.1 division initiation protein [Clostridium botulinum]